MTAQLRFPADLPLWGSRRGDYEGEPLVTRAEDGLTIAVNYHHTVVTMFMDRPEFNYAETVGSGTLHGEHVVGSIRDTAPAFLRRVWELGYPFRVMPIVTEYEATFVEDDEPMTGVMWTADGRSAMCRHKPPGFTYLDAMTPDDIQLLSDVELMRLRKLVVEFGWEIRARWLTDEQGRDWRSWVEALTGEVLARDLWLFEELE